MNRHELIDQRSLAFGQAIAERLRANPRLIEHAKANLLRWKQNCSPDLYPTFEEWTRELDGSIDGVIALLTSSDERSIRLRQSNPFVGVLSTTERNEIIDRFRRAEAETK